MHALVVWLTDESTDDVYIARYDQPHSCSEAALSLLTCMEETDCVKKDKKAMIDCLRDPVESDDCRAQRNAYTMCKV